MKRIIRPGDSEWPARLNELGPHPAPVSLFAQGRLLRPDEPAIAIVGTRRPTASGIEMARSLAAALAEARVMVVSGMAVGIDAAAHESALNAGGHTIAVLGCGLDIAYPARNSTLKSRVADRGTLLSEYRDGTPPERHNFPLRNRIIAGLSLGVVVVEGAITSGALVTARLALDANRAVYAVPGSTRNPMATGPNELIRTSQALLITCVDHIFEDLAPHLLSSQPASNEKGAAQLSDEECSVLASLDDVPTVVDAVAAAAGISNGRVAMVLARLELRGLAIRHRAGGYVLTNAGAKHLTTMR